MDINEKLAQYGSETFYNRPVFVYGDSVEASKKDDNRRPGYS